MTDAVMVALITGAAAILSGMISSILTNKIMRFRLDKVESKVDKLELKLDAHNNFIQRVYKLEATVDRLDSQLQEHSRTNLH